MTETKNLVVVFEDADGKRGLHTFSSTCSISHTDRDWVRIMDGPGIVALYNAGRVLCVCREDVVQGGATALAVNEAVAALTTRITALENFARGR